jgi:hypothetical protein
MMARRSQAALGFKVNSTVDRRRLTREEARQTAVCDQYLAIG